MKTSLHRPVHMWLKLSEDVLFTSIIIRKFCNLPSLQVAMTPLDKDSYLGNLPANFFNIRHLCMQMHPLCMFQYRTTPCVPGLVHTYFKLRGAHCNAGWTRPTGLCSTSIALFLSCLLSIKTVQLLLSLFLHFLILFDILLRLPDNIISVL
jgi:hypothetical protein